MIRKTGVDSKVWKRGFKDWSAKLKFTGPKIGRVSSQPVNQPGAYRGALEIHKSAGIAEERVGQDEPDESSLGFSARSRERPLKAGMSKCPA